MHEFMSHVNAMYTCTGTRYHYCITIAFSASVGDVTITEVTSYPKFPVLGEPVILKCNASRRSSLGYIQWTRDIETFNPIYEDPFCNSSSSAVRVIILCTYYELTHERKFKTHIEFQCISF